VRELYNALHRAVLCAMGPEILPRHLVLGDEGRTPEAGAREADTARGIETFRSGKQRAVESFERAYVGDLLKTFHGNVTRAAREAGKDRRAFGRLAKKYGLGQRQA